MSWLIWSIWFWKFCKANHRSLNIFKLHNTNIRQVSEKKRKKKKKRFKAHTEHCMEYKIKICLYLSIPLSIKTKGMKLPSQTFSTVKSCLRNYMDRIIRHYVIHVFRYNPSCVTKDFPWNAWYVTLWYTRWCNKQLNCSNKKWVQHDGEWFVTAGNCWMWVLFDCVTEYLVWRLIEFIQMCYFAEQILFRKSISRKILILTRQSMKVHKSGYWSTSFFLFRKDFFSYIKWYFTLNGHYSESSFIRNFHRFKCWRNHLSK